MSRIIELISISNMLRLTGVFIVIWSLNGCTAIRRAYYEEDHVIPRQLKEHVVQNEFPVAKGDDVVGELVLIRLEKGDTLPDIARHFSLGLDGVSAANPGVDVWVPKAGERILLPLKFVLPDAPRKGIVINLATNRLFQYKGDRGSLEVLTFPVGVGTEERPSPTGQMQVVRKVTRPTWHVPASIAADHRKKGDILPAAVLPGPQNPLGEYALYLSKPSYLIHGTNKPASIGLKATNGCIRLYPESVKKLYESTPVKSSVYIVNQPYLVGKSNGMVYMEVHAPAEDMDADEFDKMYAKLKKVELESGRPLDWSKVKTVLAEARGIPVPIFEVGQERGKTAAEPIEVRHPAKLTGRPEIPDLKTDAWSVLAAEERDETDAARLAAIINHQGPQIPARVLSKNARYQVVAGPFDDVKEANDAIKRLKIDLEIDGRLIEKGTAAGEPLVGDAAKEQKRGGSENPRGYALQIGAFSEEKYALSLVEELKQKGHRASIIRDGKRELLRVLIGRFETSKQASEEARLILQKEGIQSIIYRY